MGCEVICQDCWRVSGNAGGGRCVSCGSTRVVTKAEARTTSKVDQWVRESPACPTCGPGAPCIVGAVEAIRARLEELHAIEKRGYANDALYDDHDTGSSQLEGEIRGLEFALRALGVET